MLLKQVGYLGWCAQVKGVLDKEEVLRAKHNGHLFATHVVVGTPECLAELSVQPSAFPLSSCLRAIAVDEVDRLLPGEFRLEAHLCP